MKILFETHIQRPFQEVRDGFNQQLFNELKPPGAKVDVLRFDGCKTGDEIHLDLHVLTSTKRWVSLITDDKTTDEGWYFVDEGKLLPWPLSSWRHVHRVQKLNDTSCKIIDDIHYQCSPEYITPFVAPVLWLAFSIRPYRYKQYFGKRA